MSDNEQFDLAPQIDEPLNTFKIIHLHNKSTTFHLTRQILLDSVLNQNPYCFFYHILAKNVDDFNDIYGSFACIIERSHIEADIYLNVNADALEHIIKYIQTSKLDIRSIYTHNWKTINEIVDLATMFGMPDLVSTMRNILSTPDTIPKIALPESVEREMSNELCRFINLCKNHLGTEINDYETIINNVMNKFRQEIKRYVN